MVMHMEKNIRSGWVQQDLHEIFLILRDETYKKIIIFRGSFAYKKDYYMLDSFCIG